jgi:hypothetical protein
MELLIAMWQSLKGVYKLHNVNPFSILKSPLMQIPVFWYFSVDIRKIVNGGDPELAQELTENGLLWVTDLTEPDPWYGLPILAGMFLYLNVEVAVGKQSLSGETASKSNLARYMKDGFQSKYLFLEQDMKGSSYDDGKRSHDRCGSHSSFNPINRSRCYDAMSGSTITSWSPSISPYQFYLHLISGCRPSS